MTTPSLARGAFFGRISATVQLGDAVASWMRPTVPAHEVVQHAHADAHFVLVLGGRYRSLAYRTGVTSDGPALVFNPPGTEHRDCFADLDGSFMTVSLDAARYAGLADGPLAPDPLHLDAPGVLAGALALFRALHGRADGLHAQALLMELVAATVPAAPLSRCAPAWLGAVMDMIQDRLDTTLQLADIAAAVQLHPVYLTRAFRAATGQTPGQFQRRCRMARAFADLMAGRYSNAAIAASAGYADQAHFTRDFGALYGIAPSRFVRRLKEREQVCSVQDDASPHAP